MTINVIFTEDHLDMTMHEGDIFEVGYINGGGGVSNVSIYFSGTSLVINTEG